MVWENHRRKDAAANPGLADVSLRFAFRKPHVMAYYHAELAHRKTVYASSILVVAFGKINDLRAASQSGYLPLVIRQ